MIKKFNEFSKVSEPLNEEKEFSEGMTEFRSLLSKIDGYREELSDLRREVEDEFIGDTAQQMLEDALYDLETAITEVQEAEGWI
ncbi:MAG: hypothetical protein SLAVMIC_01009 [uncultured marine phage]|uniref:Uncharacterized protein n=1 Tax=uncultured marine phage TaxID=707152 RepID=A0A8D9C9V9_9VIRU|nr:MAG: hypothetical protein SLAVMIC_01009 [uncultured marine phage]